MSNAELASRVFVLSGLRGRETSNSALENYAVGFCGAFTESGMKISILDLTGMYRLQKLGGIRAPFWAKFVQNLGLLGVVVEFLYSVFLAIAGYRGRKKSVLFVVNASVWNHHIVFFYHFLGYRVIYWIVDYYPSLKERTNRFLSMCSDMTIVINPYIAEEVPQNVPVWVFQGGTRNPPPVTLPRIEEGQPIRLLYAGKLNHLNCVDQILELVSKRSDLHLTLFGDGELDGLARSLASRFSNIEVRGLCPHAEVMEAMKTAHGVLSMRRLDNDYYKGFFPSKVIEMLASPSHVLVSRLGRVTENLENAVVFVEGGSSLDLLKAIKKTTEFDEKDVEMQLERRRKLIEENFNWRRLAGVVRSGYLK